MIKDFCTNLINYRQKAQLTRKEVADKLGITEIAYGAYERGKRLPDIEKLCALSHLFEITPNELLNFKQDEFVLAKNTWLKYDFIVEINPDESVSLIKDYSVEPKRKLIKKDGKIDFQDIMLRKEASFFNKQSFIAYTKDVARREIERVNQDDEARYYSSETFYTKEFEGISSEQVPPNSKDIDIPF